MAAALKQRPRRAWIRAAETGSYVLGQALRLVWPARLPVRKEIHELSRGEAIALLRTSVRNWPLRVMELIAPHGTELTYRTASGHRIRCRACTSDLAETAIVSSG